METYQCWFCTERHPGTGTNGIFVHVIEKHPDSNVARFIMLAITSEGSPALPPELPRLRSTPSSPQTEPGAQSPGTRSLLGGVGPGPHHPLVVECYDPETGQWNETEVTF